MKVVYENDFLEDFQNANSNGGDPGANEEGEELGANSNDGEGNEAAAVLSSGGGSGSPAEVLY